MNSDKAGCFSYNKGSSTFSSLIGYSAKAPYNTVPLYPAKLAIADQWGQSVKILGCNTVSTSTPIVTIPNRLINSGHSGHDLIKGSVDAKLPKSCGGSICTCPLETLWPSSKCQGQFTKQAPFPKFDVCLACLYYAKATADDTLMETDTQCAPCFAEYCWVPSS